MPHNPFAELEQLIKNDSDLREELVKKDELFSGYHPEMEALHTANGKRLQQLIAEYGWPMAQKYGEEIENAAWMITMHAISLPSLQRNVLALLKQDGDRYPAAQSAMLEDRILVFSGKKQIFGSQMDWDENGILNPFPIEESDKCHTRRKQAGLEPLAEAIKRLRNRAESEHEHPPHDLTKHTELRESWMLRTGWISDPSEIDPAYDRYRITR